jgi:hypothetical protein
VDPITAMKTIATTAAMNLLKGREERYPAEKDMADSPLGERLVAGPTAERVPKTDPRNPDHIVRLGWTVADCEWMRNVEVSRCRCNLGPDPRRELYSPMLLTCERGRYPLNFCPGRYRSLARRRAIRGHPCAFDVVGRGAGADSEHMAIYPEEDDPGPFEGGTRSHYFPGVSDSVNLASPQLLRSRHAPSA